MSIFSPVVVYKLLTVIISLLFFKRSLVPDVALELLMTVSYLIASDFISFLCIVHL